MLRLRKRGEYDRLGALGEIVLEGFQHAIEPAHGLGWVQHVVTVIDPRRACRARAGCRAEQAVQVVADDEPRPDRASDAANLADELRKAERRRPSRAAADVQTD